MAPIQVRIVALFIFLSTVSPTNAVPMCAPDAEATVGAKANIGASSHPENTVTNKKWVLHQRPKGSFCPNSDVQLETETICHSSLKNDEILVQTSVLSCDAFIRTMLDEEAHHGVVPIRGTLPAIGFGKVIAAGPDAKKKIGTTVAGMMGAQTHARVKANEAFPMLTFPFMSRTASLGLMGMSSGLTAYAGVFYVCRKPRKGETVVVTGAAGAVGSVAAQLCKTTGARVIGVAGGEKKGAYLVDSLNLDGAIDYKSDKSLEEQIGELCPDGIDFIYDNVGGKTLDALLSRINPGARIVICGAISQYSGRLNKGLVEGPSNYLKLAEQNAQMCGFTVMQYMMRLPFMLCGMFYLYLRGKVHLTEHFETGIESFPHALHKLFTGGHIGKMLVDLKNDT